MTIGCCDPTVAEEKPCARNWLLTTLCAFGAITTRPALEPLLTMRCAKGPAPKFAAELEASRVMILAAALGLPGSAACAFAACSPFFGLPFFFLFLFFGFFFFFVGVVRGLSPDSSFAFVSLSAARTATASSPLSACSSEEAANHAHAAARSASAVIPATAATTAVDEEFWWAGVGDEDVGGAPGAGAGDGNGEGTAPQLPAILRCLISHDGLSPPRSMQLKRTYIGQHVLPRGAE